MPTIATSALSTSSRSGQLHSNNEFGNISHTSDNISRNNLVNVQLQQGPILIPSTNANITPSLPMQSVVAAVQTPHAHQHQSNTPCSVQTSHASMNGLMQVVGSTPCLIPQPNGLPPLILNVPTANYVQVPTQPSAGCSIPLVSSLLAANILANNSILNGGNNGINNQPNNNVPRPTLVTNNNSGLFLTPPTLSGLQPTITNMSAAADATYTNISATNSTATIISYKSDMGGSDTNPNGSVGRQEELRARVQEGQHAASTSESTSLLQMPMDRYFKAVKCNTNNSIVLNANMAVYPNNILQQKRSQEPKSSHNVSSSNSRSSGKFSETGKKKSSPIKNEQQLINSNHALSNVVHEGSDSEKPQRVCPFGGDGKILHADSDQSPYSKDNLNETKRKVREIDLERRHKQRSPAPSTSFCYRNFHTPDETVGVSLNEMI